jgi:2-haloacid dehalogenase
MSLVLSRREAIAAAGAVAIQGSAAFAAERSVQAVAFDAFTIFDPRAVVPAVEAAAPGRGAVLTAAWRTRQFEYGWLRTLTGSYVDFWQITGDALEYAFEAEKIALPPAARARIMEAHLRLDPWPDAAAALKAMAGTGLRLAYLTNWTQAMLEANTKAAGLTGLFEVMLSTDSVRAYKPDPRAYAMAETTLRIPREKIVFAAFGGWDAAGGKAFGLDTFWVNRLGAPIERLGVQPDAVGGTLSELAHYAIR